MRGSALSAAQLPTHRAAEEAAGNTWEAFFWENGNHAFHLPFMRKNMPYIRIRYPS